jgi:S1-C subfamily serine protease
MSSTLTCPKCGHQQTNPVECEGCGLLFRKYAQAQERKLETVQAPPPPAPAQRSSVLVRISAAVVLVAVTAALTVLLMRNRQPATTGPQPANPVATAVVQPPPVQPAPDQPAPSPQTASQPVVQPPPQPASDSLAASSLEQAKNGTVAIETPWGKGSGFFITDSTIVTNKHVVQPDPNQVAEIRHKVTTGRELIDLEQQKIAQLRAQLRRMEDSPTRRQLVVLLQEKERQLAEVLPMQQEAEARLKEMERPLTTSDIKLFLVDGTEFTPNSTQVSATRDLAILSVYTSKAVVLQPAARNKVLNQGDKVFTIGNPVGLRNTVTSGIFSGYRQHKESGEVLLQTDAPINPGNSGGPLIDERGRVHGINTMIIRDTEGIGFAIPIQTVFDEFSITPPQG